MKTWLHPSVFPFILNLFVLRKLVSKCVSISCHLQHCLPYILYICSVLISPPCCTLGLAGTYPRPESLTLTYWNWFLMHLGFLCVLVGPGPWQGGTYMCRCVGCVYEMLVEKKPRPCAWRVNLKCCNTLERKETLFVPIARLIWPLPLQPRGVHVCVCVCVSRGGPFEASLMVLLVLSRKRLPVH